MIKIQRNIRVLYVEPYKLPTEMIIKNNLFEKRNLVKGDIEYSYMSDDYNVALICNEEGKINGMPMNRDIGHDIIFGPFLIVGDNNSGEDRSLSKEQINKYKEYFNELSILKTYYKVQKIINDKKEKNIEM